MWTLRVSATWLRVLVVSTAAGLVAHLQLHSVSALHSLRLPCRAQGSICVYTTLPLLLLSFYLSLYIYYYPPILREPSGPYEPSGHLLAVFPFAVSAAKSLRARNARRATARSNVPRLSSRSRPPTTRCAAGVCRLCQYGRAACSCRAPASGRGEC